MSTTSNDAPTIRDIERLVTGVTPQFSQQVEQRVKALIEPLDENNEVRKYGEKWLLVLERIADGTTTGTRRLGVPDDENEGWKQIPSHPKGGIAPGFVDHSH